MINDALCKGIWIIFIIVALLIIFVLRERQSILVELLICCLSEYGNSVEDHFSSHCYPVVLLGKLDHTHTGKLDQGGDACDEDNYSGERVIN